MNLKNISILPLFLLFGICQGQPIYFNKTFNPNNTYAIASSVVVINEDFYFSGVSDDSIYHNRGMYISKGDCYGNIKYWKTYFDTVSTYAAGYAGSLIYDINGNLALGGARHFPGSLAEGALFRINLNGDTISSTFYPDTSYVGWSQIAQCKQTFEGGYALIGNVTVGPYNSNVLVIITDSLGNELWSKDYERGAIDHGYSIIQTPDKGYLIGYYHYYAGHDIDHDPRVFKIDSLGEFQWEVNLGGPTKDYFCQVCMAHDGNYMVGTSVSDSIWVDLYWSKIKIFKISPDGDIIWSKYIGKQELNNKLYNIRPDRDGGYIACGTRWNYYGQKGSWDDGYGWLFKIDANGDSIWYRDYRFYTGPAAHFNTLYDVALANDGGYYGVGQAQEFGHSQRAWIIKVDSIGCDTPDCNTVGVPKPIVNNNSVSIYPNPANQFINIEQIYNANSTSICSIYNLYGIKLSEYTIPRFQTKLKVPLSNYPSGVYLIVINDMTKVILRQQIIVNH